jgi:hypothetical protein
MVSEAEFMCVCFPVCIVLFLSVGPQGEIQKIRNDPAIGDPFPVLEIVELNGKVFPTGEAFAL